MSAKLKTARQRSGYLRLTTISVFALCAVTPAAYAEDQQQLSAPTSDANPTVPAATASPSTTQEDAADTSAPPPSIAKQPAAQQMTGQQTTPVPDIRVTAPKNRPNARSKKTAQQGYQPSSNAAAVAEPAPAQPADGSVAAGYRVDTVKDIGPFSNMKLQDTPYTVNVLSSDFLENTASYAVPGSFVTKMPGGLQYGYTDQRPVTGTPLFRGTGNSGQQRVDGLPIATTGSLLFLEPFDRVEALSSVSGFFYGIGPTTGQLNYVLKRPKDDAFADLTTGVLIGDSVYSHLDFGGKSLNGNIGYRFNVVGQDGETLVNDQTLSKYSVSGAIDVKLSDRALLQFDGAYSKWNGTIPAIWILNPGAQYSTTPVPDPSKLWSQPWTRADTNTLMLGMNLTLQLTDSLTSRSAVRYVKTAYADSNIFNCINPDNTYDQDVTIIANYDRWNIAADQYFDLKLDTFNIKHKFTAGVQTNYSEQTQPQDAAAFLYGFTLGQPLSTPAVSPKPVFPPVGTLSWYTPNEVTSTNLVLGDQIDFNRYWQALLGVAYSQIEQVRRNTSSVVTSDYYADKVTPSLALLFKPTESTTVYGSYVEGLQQGLAVNGTQFTNDGDVLPPFLRKQYEVGIKVTDGNVFYTVAAYKIDSALQYILNNGDGTLTYVQNGLQKSQGIDTSATGEIFPGLRVLGGVSYVDARIEKNDSAPETVGKRVPSAAEWLVKGTLEYDLPFIRNLTLTGGAYYTSSFFDDDLNTDKLPDYLTYDAGFRYTTTIGQTPAILRFNVSNLTDESYWVVGGVVNDPRRFSGSLELKF